MNSISGRKLILVLALVLGAATFGLWLWAARTPVPHDLQQRQPGKAIPGLLN